MTTIDAPKSITTCDEVSRESFWHEQIQRKQASGMSRAAYCRKHELNYDQFGYWEQRWTPSSFSSATTELLPVQLSESTATKSSPLLTTLCTLVLNNGSELKVHDQALLPLLLSLLR